ncbi:MAG TPA: tetratricopeptide repeat-containing glycosyltransferase family protein [Acetobacteraceae bacterium]|nr:tetratricopeptide repeat-containing glycosyltransferase family protein [Acetobacteraceae bacterium]
MSRRAPPPPAQARQALPAQARRAPSPPQPFPEALFGQAMTLHQAGALPAAESAYRAVLAASPRHAATMTLLATVVAQTGRPEEAVRLFDASLKLDRNQELAWFNRGNALFSLKRYAEALASYNRAVALWPGHAPLQNNRGNALFGLGRKLEALAAFDRAIRTAPDYAEAHFNRGNVLRALDRRTEALASFDRAAALAPDHADLQFNRGLLRLRQGDYTEGWPLIEWRWLVPDAPPRRVFSQKLWLGEEDIAGKTLLLHAEQGFGDTIQYCRYAPLAAERGARVVLEVQRPLVPALVGLEGVAQLVAAGDALPPFDLHCPLMSLPLAFRTGLDSVPRRVPYLRAAPERVRDWAARLGDRGRSPRVGLVWAGSAANTNDAQRSAGLRALLPLLGCGAELVALQKDLSAADRTLLAATPGLRPLGDELADFGDTAAVLELLDLVVTVDTAVAHLAGALGRPVWVMLSPAADWRWLAGEADAPWYPAARLFRWDSAKGWSGVVASVKAALIEFCRDQG